MDFGKVLQIATKNRETSDNEGKYYRTKFAPPKKETKVTKQLSENIKKFLRQKEEEEKAKQLEQKRKLTNLLAMRDDRSKNKIRKMLKVTKSANKSVLDDAIDINHTAVTIEGPEQPDQDDYGYVSNEANAFYQRYIEKVKDVKEDKGFAPSRPQSLKDLSGTKERVKAAIVREKEEKNGVRQRNRVSHVETTKCSKSSTSSSSGSSSSSKTLYDPEAEKREAAERKREEMRKKALNRKPQPPPMDFHQLLKLAEQKQHEEIVIPTEVKSKEPIRLLTAKEKREQEEHKRYLEARRKREAESQKGTTNTRTEQSDRIPKLNDKNSSQSSLNSSSSNKKVISKIGNSSTENTTNKNKTLDKPQSSNSSKNAVKSNSNSALTINNKSTTSSSSQNERNKILNTKGSTSTSSSSNSTVREFPPRDTKIASMKPREFPLNDIRKQRPEEKRKPAVKRRIIDDDESEYDSEMDDFIDDGDAEMDYSSHIKEIFGYDRSRYNILEIKQIDMALNFI